MARYNNNCLPREGGDHLNPTSMPFEEYIPAFAGTTIRYTDIMMSAYSATSKIDPRLRGGDIIVD